MELLYKVFAYQEATDNELWASTHKSLDIGSVFLIQWHCYRCLHCFSPCGFEILTPFWQVSKTACVSQHDIKLLVISGGQFGNQNPGKEIKTRQTKMMEVVFFDASPATYNGELHFIDMYEKSLTELQPSWLFLVEVFLRDFRIVPKAPISLVDTNSPRGTPRDLEGLL